MHQYFLSIKTFLLLAATAAIVLAIAGCGGSDGSEASANGGEITVQAGSLSKTQFVARADAMCTKSKAQATREFHNFLKEGKQSGKSKEAASAEIVNTIIAPTYEDLIDQLSNLGAPQGDEEAIADFLNTLQDNLATAKKDPTDAINSLSSPFKEASELAGEYGLTGCASSLV